MRGVTGHDKHHSMDVLSLFAIVSATCRGACARFFCTRILSRGLTHGVSRMGVGPAGGGAAPVFSYFLRKAQGRRPTAGPDFLRKAKGITTDGTFLIEDSPCIAWQGTSRMADAYGVAVGGSLHEHRAETWPLPYVVVLRSVVIRRTFDFGVSVFRLDLTARSGSVIVPASPSACAWSSMGV